jgi:hypothetical protein
MLYLLLSDQSFSPWVPYLHAARAPLHSVLTFLWCLTIGYHNEDPLQTSNPYGSVSYHSAGKPFDSANLKMGILPEELTVPHLAGPLLPYELSVATLPQLGPIPSVYRHSVCFG